MTAGWLHHLSWPTSDDGTRFEGGRGAWRVEAKYGDVTLAFTTSTQASHTTSVLALSDEDLDDLELAIGRAREARAAWYTHQRSKENA